MPNAHFVCIDDDTELCDQTVAPALQQCRVLRRLRPSPQSICIARKQLALLAGKLFGPTTNHSRFRDAGGSALEVRRESSEFDDGSHGCGNFLQVEGRKSAATAGESLYADRPDMEGIRN